MLIPVNFQKLVLTLFESRDILPPESLTEVEITDLNRIRNLEAAPHWQHRSHCAIYRLISASQ